MDKHHPNKANQLREALKRLNNMIRTYNLPIFICIILALSWWGKLDSLALDSNSESIKNAAIIFGMARTINGLISLIQSAELSGFIASVQIGELLDPFNDLIEQFSTVMVWSISSLVLQKVLLNVFGSILFKLIFTTFCIIFFLIFWMYTDRIISSKKFLNRIWVSLLIIASLRFSILLVCLLTFIFDYLFISEESEASFNSVRTFKDELSSGINYYNAANEEDITQQIDDLSIEKASLKADMEADMEELKQIETPLLKFLREKSEEELQLEKKISDNEIAIESINEELSHFEDQIACYELRKKGESCGGIMSKIKSVVTLEWVNEFSTKIDKIINDFFTLLVSLVLTTIIFPLIFLYSVYRFFKFAISKFLMMDEIDRPEQP